MKCAKEGIDFIVKHRTILMKLLRIFFFQKDGYNVVSIRSILRGEGSYRWLAGRREAVFCIRLKDHF